jgi:hypothetical protein
MTPAPEWLTRHEHADRRLGRICRYHSRSDAHSIALCEFIVDDLLAACPPLRTQAARGDVCYGINLSHRWPQGKQKTIDLAIGVPTSRPLLETGEAQLRKVRALGIVLVSLEAKAVMTEHGKSQPRVYDELSSSHEIVHQGRQDAIAAGVAVVNIAETFISPLRQRVGQPVEVTRHKQPDAAMGMIEHLRGLPIRDQVGQVGFDACTTIVVDCDNEGPARLHSMPPAPQPGGRDHYATFLEHIARLYANRFAMLPEQNQTRTLAEE